MRGCVAAVVAAEEDVLARWQWTDDRCPQDLRWAARAGLDDTVLDCQIAAVLALPWLAPWTEVILTLALSKGLAVLGVIVLLRGGQVSFGHAMFMTGSAYCVAFIARAFGGGELITTEPP